MHDVEIAPLGLETFLMTGLTVLFVSVLTLRTLELLQQRYYRLGKLQRLGLTFVILSAYLALPVGLQLNERFAPALTLFTSHPFMFLALCIISYAGAVGFYLALGGKRKRDKEQYP